MIRTVLVVALTRVFVSTDRVWRVECWPNRWEIRMHGALVGSCPTRSLVDRVLRDRGGPALNAMVES